MPNIIHARAVHWRTTVARATILLALIAAVAPSPNARASIHTLSRDEWQTSADTISIRLLSDVSSSAAMKGKPVRAMVIAPLTSNAQLVLAPRSILEGTVLDAGKENVGGERHYVQLHFTSLTLPDGSRMKFDARVMSVDNSRESVTNDGRILGPAKASLAKSKEDWAAAALGSIAPVGGLILFAATRGETDERNRQINLPAGTDLSIKISDFSPPTISALAKLDSVSSNTQLLQLLTRVPLRASAVGGRIPGDFVNVILLGTDAQLKKSFTAAGWDSPDKMGTKSDFDTFIKTAKGQGYSHEPVSQQLMFGRPPDLVFQRVADTFAKRHHVRMWRTAEMFNGQAVWVAAATHDIGVEFSTAHRSFTHRTDNNIDGEREKIVNDLLAYQQVAAQSYVLRTPVPDQNARGTYVSDWRVAVLALVR